MKAEELVGNEYYVVNHNNNEYLFINKPEKRYSDQCYLLGDYFCSYGACLNGIYNSGFKYKEYRLATQEERNHIDACIKAGKYVEAPKPEIINDYEIF